MVLKCSSILVICSVLFSVLKSPTNKLFLTEWQNTLSSKYSSILVMSSELWGQGHSTVFCHQVKNYLLVGDVSSEKMHAIPVSFG